MNMNFLKHLIVALVLWFVLRQKMSTETLSILKESGENACDDWRN